MTASPNPEPLRDDIADDIAEAIHTLRHLFSAQQYWVLGDEPDNLTHMEGRVLIFVGRHPGATQGDMVLRWARDRAQLTRLIGSLRTRGLIETRTDAADLRVQRLFLTPAGEIIHATVRAQRLAIARRAVDGLAEAEQQMLAWLLGRLRGNLERPGPID